MSVVLIAKPDRVKSQCNAPWHDFIIPKSNQKETILAGELD
jgi:hypothetical protein